MNQDSVLVVVPRLWAGRSGVRVQAGARNFSLFPNVHTGCVLHSRFVPTSCNRDKAAGVTTTLYLHPVLMLRKSELYLHYLTRFRKANKDKFPFTFYKEST